MLANPDDYSPAATLITFDRPIPLLRQPILAGAGDSLVLGFKDRQSWESAYKFCESNIIQQCEAGARIGCSVSASSKCAPPWWKSVIGGGVSKEELIEREKCEEREMSDCFEASRLNCRKFAEDKCLPVFKDARIVVKGGGGDEEVKKCVSELISRVCMGETRVGGVELWKLKGSWSEVKSRIGFSILRGSDMLEKQF
ncbi:uncharacterized protein LOC112513149 [Cynara cardunculus var. scolymus]|uniref:Uncharacterized protein n=1 Tax=Cynara cardunculus var. scolymus TaxID=59895 RepID=A0A103Y7G3_CYNCS|nr:uncharacterized protein LOC112513149 [Cynara cardunculus var. scolymus]KVI03895.1 hypothetical protein Ccrd_017813 [Cynara cardunculus var. scolymus]